MRTLRILPSLAVVAALVLSASTGACVESVPAQPGKEQAAAPKPTWPGSRTGLVFLWENGTSQNQVRNSAGEDVMCQADLRDGATYARFSAMDLVSGSFVAKAEFARDLLDACRKSGAFSLEAVVRPASADLKEPAAIVSFAGDKQVNFMLGMVKDKLVVSLRTSQQAAESALHFATLKAGVPQHVIVTFSAGKLLCYVNGESKAPGLAVNGDLQPWTPAQLVFGDDYTGAKDWPGTLEGIAIYSRALTAEEAKADAAFYLARLQKRKPARRVVVDARLYDISPNTTPDTLDPGYHRLLLIDNYEVVKVIEGTCDDKKIGVARWGILDDRVVKLDRVKGKVHRLVLEAWEDNFQLDSERQSNSTEEMTLPLYYNVEKPSRAERLRGDILKK